MTDISAQYSEKIKSIISALPAILKESSQKIPLDIQTLINSNMNPGTNTRDPLSATWNKTDRLNNFKNLSRSFTQGQPGSLTEIRTSATGATINIGSALPYAGVQEYGGFVKSKGKMEKYFWAMYYKSKAANPFFKAMALSVAKTGGIKIKARPYFEPAIKEYSEKRSTDVLQNIINELIKIF